MSNLAISVTKMLLVTAVVFVQFAGFAQSQPAAEADAASVAKAYVQRLKTGAVSEAVNEFWDTDYFFSSALGLTYLDLPAAEKKATRDALANFIAASFSNPNLVKLFSTIEIRSAKPTPISDSLLAVTLELSGNSGRFNGTNTMLLAKAGPSWKIVDSRQNSSPSIRVAVVMMWLGERRSGSDSMAAVLERAADNMRRKANSQ